MNGIAVLVLHVGQFIDVVGAVPRETQYAEKTITKPREHNTQRKPSRREENTTPREILQQREFAGERACSRESLGFRV